MNALRALLKLSVFGCALGLYVFLAFIVLAWHFFNVDRARPLLVKLISFISRIGLWVMGIQVEQEGVEHGVLSQNKLIVCNHLSYLDVFIISSVEPTCFVTSVEMKNTFFLGHLCQLGGCLFVERRNRRFLSQEVKELSQALGAGLNVTIFPEATAGNGEALLRFRRPLYQSAVEAKRAVQPFCLNYHQLDGEEVSLKTRDILFWHDDTPFPVHAFRFFSRKKLHVKIQKLPLIDWHPEVNKEQFNEQSFLAIKAVYREIR